MKVQLNKRLHELQEEYQKGQQRLSELEQETTELQTTLLRISGAIQVLTEELEKINTKAAEHSSNDLSGS